MLYVGVVITGSLLLRQKLSREPLTAKLQCDEMPNEALLWKLCQDIMLVREYGDYSLEVDLFAQLIFVYRSPETMIKLTALQPPTAAAAATTDLS